MTGRNLGGSSFKGGGIDSPKIDERFADGPKVGDSSGKDSEDAC